jgi:drug/metabolite transporter (DMT)-like permease
MNIILGYIFYFIAASASPLQRRWLAKKKDHTVDPKGQTAFAFHTMLFLVLGSLLFPLFEPIVIKGSALYLLISSIVCGVFGAFYFILSYRAQRHVEAGVASIVSNIYTPITIILSIIFLHEGLTNIQIVGTILLLFSMFIVSKKHRIGKFRFDKYFLMMLLSGVMLGVLLVYGCCICKPLCSWNNPSMPLMRHEDSIATNSGLFLDLLHV